MKTVLRNQPRWLTAAFLRRSLWTLMLASHLPALVSSVNKVTHAGLDPSHLGGFLGLLATVVFFVLKIWDVPWLRFRADRRTFAALTVAVALIHADVIAASLNLSSVPKDVPIAGATLLVASLARSREAIDSAVAGAKRKTARHAQALVDTLIAWYHAFQPHPELAVVRIRTPRAPPF